MRWYGMIRCHGEFLAYAVTTNPWLRRLYLADESLLMSWMQDPSRVGVKALCLSASGGFSALILMLYGHVIDNWEKLR
jgi:hypothetical protein